MRRLEDATVAIVGLGLMGGSLAGALRGQCEAVIGVARRTESIEIALARGLIDRGTTDLAGGVHRADVVVLATPVRVILRLLRQIGPLLPLGCLLMDLGSTKEQVVSAMAQLPVHVQPLGGHPMCGKESSGIEVADSTLYLGHVFVLTPLSRTSPAARSLGRALVEAVGARPLTLAPDRHDRLVATISHLPYLLACGLVDTAEGVAAADPTVWDVAASGFRDTSRLAASDVTMMLDILLTNREAVLEALGSCQARLRDLAHLLEAASADIDRASADVDRASGEEEQLRAALTAIRDRRANM